MMALRNWARSVWMGLKTTWIGLTITVPYIFRRPYTLQYPEEVPELPPTERGLHVFDQKLFGRAFTITAAHYDPGPFGVGHLCHVEPEDEGAAND